MLTRKRPAKRSKKKPKSPVREEYFRTIRKMKDLIEVNKINLEHGTSYKTVARAKYYLTIRKDK